MNYEMLREIFAARKRSFLFLLFLALLNIALVVYLSGWQRPALEKAQKDWFAKREALASGQAVGAATVYQNGVRDLALFQQRLIPKKDFARFLSQLYDTAQKDGLSIKGITYKPVVIKDESMVSYDIVLSVAGRYPSIKSFIADLARYREIVTLDNLSLSNTSPTEEAVELKVDMSVYLKMEGA